MRKFIIELIVSIVMITIGVSMCFFEFSDYDYVPYGSDMKQVDLSYTVNQKHPLNLDLDDDLPLYYEYDESLGDQVKVEFNSSWYYREKEDELKIKDNGNWRSWKTYYQAFIDGLKDHQIIVFHDHDYFDEEGVTITCTRENRKNINITH